MHTTCARSWCTWRASCVVAKHWKKIKKNSVVCGCRGHDDQEKKERRISPQIAIWNQQQTLTAWDCSCNHMYFIGKRRLPGRDLICTQRLIVGNPPPGEFPIYYVPKPWTWRPEEEDPPRSTKFFKGVPLPGGRGLLCSLIKIPEEESRSWLVNIVINRKPPRGGGVLAIKMTPPFKFGCFWVVFEGFRVVSNFALNKVAPPWIWTKLFRNGDAKVGGKCTV